MPHVPRRLLAGVLAALAAGSAAQVAAAAPSPPSVPPEIAVHVAALRGSMGELAAGLSAASSFDAMGAVLDAPAGNEAHQAASALATYRKATCG